MRNVPSVARSVVIPDAPTTIVPREFSLEEGEVTPTLKLRRRVIHDHFAAEIEQLYAE